MAYGTPHSLDDVAAYYTHIRGGRRPSEELIDRLKDRYRLVGGTTPLLEITRATGDELERRLNADKPGSYRVFLGMKHWHPFIEEAVGEMAKQGIERAVGLVLAPHYSRMSIAGYFRYFDEAQEKLGTKIGLERIESWHLHSPYLEAVARRIRHCLVEFPPGEEVTVIFTAHSLPEKILDQNDPYKEQLRETSEAIASALGAVSLEQENAVDSPVRWAFSYQSAGQTADPWLGPDLVDTVHSLAERGVKNIIVASIGFVSDHLEILYDIDHEAQEAARGRGITLKRTEMLNASPDFVEGLAELIRSRVMDRRTSRAQPRS